MKKLMYLTMFLVGSCDKGSGEGGVADLTARMDSVEADFNHLWNSFQSKDNYKRSFKELINKFKKDNYDPAIMDETSVNKVFNEIIQEISLNKTNPDQYDLSQEVISMVRIFQDDDNVRGIIEELVRIDKKIKEKQIELKDLEKIMQEKENKLKKENNWNKFLLFKLLGLFIGMSIYF